MRYLIAVTAAAPLALLAACGGDATAGEAEMEEVAAAPAEPAMPTVPADSLETVDYAGSYTLTRINGSKATVTLDPEADAYTYVAMNGKETDGSFKRLDGNRIEVEDFDGKPGYFAVGDGAIFYLPDAETSVDDVMISNMYRRDDSEGAVEAADASDQAATEKSA